MAQIEGKEFLIMRESDLYAVISRVRSSSTDILAANYGTTADTMAQFAIDLIRGKDQPVDIDKVTAQYTDGLLHLRWLGSDPNDPDQQAWEALLAEAGNRYQVSIRRSGVK